MANEYQFFKSCLKHAQDVYNTLVSTPRASGTKYKNEVFEILEQINTSLVYGEITPTQAKELREGFLKLDFANLSAARAAIKASVKIAQT